MYSVDPEKTSAWMWVRSLLWYLPTSSLNKILFLNFEETQILVLAVFGFWLGDSSTQDLKYLEMKQKWRDETRRVGITRPAIAKRSRGLKRLSLESFYGDIFWVQGRWRTNTRNAAVVASEVWLGMILISMTFLFVHQHHDTTIVHTVLTSVRFIDFASWLNS